MINKFTCRVLVTLHGVGSKKTNLFERIISPEEAACLDLAAVFNGLLQLFPTGSEISISLHGL